MLQFDLSGRIMGCTIQTYLLEKVRDRVAARGRGLVQQRFRGVT